MLHNKWKKIEILLCIIIVAVICIMLVSTREKESPENASEQYDITSLENKTYPANLSNMYKWRTEYIGDNSAVGNITDAWFIVDDTQLKKDGCELQTSQEPYEVTVCYVSEESEQDVYTVNEEYLEKDAALFFSLVHNAGIVNVSINGQTVGKFTRTEMEEKYGELWSKSESYEDFCKTYDYITYLQSIAVSETGF